MKLYDELLKIGEYYMAGFAKDPKVDKINATANAILCHLENVKMPSGKKNDVYYPNGANLYDTGEAYWYFYCYSLVPCDLWGIHADKTYDVLNKLPKELHEDFWNLKAKMETYINGECIDWQRGLGGNSYVHSIINYERILKEGLDSYLDRIKKNEDKNPSFYKALKTAWKAIKVFHKRSLEYLKSQKCPNEKLIKALKNVPFKPAKTFYEAMVCVNFMFHIDGADNVGRITRYLAPYFTEDVSDCEAIKLFREFWKIMDKTCSWHADFKFEKGEERINKLALKASHSIRRPNSAIFVTENEPDETWEAILDSWASLSSNPAIYNWELYTKQVQKFYNVTDEDLKHLAFGGCTETMVEGMSNVGSVECGILPCMYLMEDVKNNLCKYDNFEDYYKHFLLVMRKEIEKTVRMHRLDQRIKAEENPLPMRSLLIDDCIDKGIEYQAGGARYNGCCFNFGGTTNTINSLYTLKKLAFGKKYKNEEIVEAVNSNFENYSEIYADIIKLPKFGNDVEEVDQIAERFMGAISEMVQKRKSWRGDACYGPSHIVLTGFVDFGKWFGASLDGRRAFEPIGDSIGAYQGTDIKGPTSLLNSVTKIPLKNFFGTPVTNIRLSKGNFADKKQREKLIALLKSYFQMGGMQIQATVIDQSAMKDALVHPENYKSLIIRIGGHSEYFNNLSEELKMEVIKRYEHMV